MPDLFVAPDSNTAGVEPQTDTKPTINSTVLPPINTNKIGFFTTYSESPQNIGFQNQDPDEAILLFMRRDFITNLPWILFSILLLFLPFIVMFIINFTNSKIVSIPVNFTLILLSFYYLITATYTFVNFIIWYYNASAITTKRVIDVDFEDIVYKNVAETKLSLVQDVSYTQVGVFAAVFDYGDVLIQTAAALDNFKLEAIPRPQRVVQITENLIGK